MYHYNRLAAESLARRAEGRLARARHYLQYEPAPHTDKEIQESVNSAIDDLCTINNLIDQHLVVAYDEEQEPFE